MSPKGHVRALARILVNAGLKEALSRFLSNLILIPKICARHLISRSNRLRASD